MKPGVHRHRPPLQAGYSLLELAYLLAALAALAFAIGYKTQSTYSQRQALQAQNHLELADRQLRHHALLHGRLPCPDSNGDGVEDCGGPAKGYLPYVTLGLKATSYTAGEPALRYGVNRNTAFDLAATPIPDRFKPTNAHGTAYDTPGERNALDLCRALAAGKLAAADTNWLHVVRHDASLTAMAYALASPGTVDADKDGNFFDGVNAGISPAFAAPDTPTMPTYDDATLARGFADLYTLLRCEATERSLHLMADVVAVEEEVFAFYEANKMTAAVGIAANTVTGALAFWSAKKAWAQHAAAAEMIVTGTAALTAATAACVPPIIVGCALIPLYTAAVSSAGTAQGLATAATALYVASGLTRAAAIGINIAAYVQLNEMEPDPAPSLPNLGNDILNAEADYNSKSGVVAGKQLAMNNAQTAMDAAKAASDANKAKISSAISALGVANHAAAQAVILERVIDGGPDVANPAPPLPPAPPLAAEPGLKPAIDGYANALRARDTAQALFDGYNAPCQSGTIVVDGQTKTLDAATKADMCAKATQAQGFLNDANTALTQAATERTAAIARAQTIGGGMHYYDLVLRCHSSSGSTSAACTAAKAAHDALHGPDTWDYAQRTTYLATVGDTLEPKLTAIPAVPADHGLCGANACQLDAVADYASHYQDWQTKKLAYDAAKTEYDNAKAEADGAYDKWKRLTCADQGKGYDAAADACTNDKPLDPYTAPNPATDPICDSNSTEYNEKACITLQAGGNQPGSGLGHHALNILRTLEQKGTVE